MARRAMQVAASTLTLAFVARGSPEPALAEKLTGSCMGAACAPGNEFCGKPFENAPAFHLMSQHGCAENDPNGPVFDPVHGVIHHFYQIHLAAPPGHGPDYGHFVSKDFINWAEMPVAIWNGLDSSVWPPKKTPYDNEAIFTGSAIVVDGAGPGGKGPGVVNIYPGLCNKNDWPQCATGTVLAQAVPADYATDVLLTNWTKPSYNPIMQNTQRDPSTPWKEANGEWRLRTFDAKVYGSASDADLLAGKWYYIGHSTTMRQCECPSFYPLPAATPGFEAAYEAAKQNGSLPTHVHKTSCGGDWWQIGSYDAGAPKTTGTLKATPGWEDLFVQRKIDHGNFYASKDNVYPTKSGGQRRINWGWAQVTPASAQTLPREITFNAAARTLEQAPIQELEGLRLKAAVQLSGVALKANDRMPLQVPSGVAKQSEIVATFTLPSASASFGIAIGAAANITVSYNPGASDVKVNSNGVQDTLRILPEEKTLELRVFSDNTFVEVYFQKGRVAMTAKAPNLSDGIELFSGADIDVQTLAVYPMRSIWTTPEEIRKAPRVYGAENEVTIV